MPRLPRGWTAHSVPEVYFGRTYFHDEHTGRTTWEPPPPPPPPPLPSAAPAPSQEERDTAGAALADDDDFEWCIPDEEEEEREQEALSADMDNIADIQNTHNKFKELLLSIGIAPYSQWSNWVTKLASEPEYLAVSSYEECRNMFVGVVGDLVEKEHKCARNAKREAASLCEKMSTLRAREIFAPGANAQSVLHSLGCSSTLYG